MFKKIFNSGALYFLIAILFAVSAIAKTISNDSVVIALTWFCALGFAGVGIWQMTRKISQKS